MESQKYSHKKIKSILLKIKRNRKEYKMFNGEDCPVKITPKKIKQMYKDSDVLKLWKLNCHYFNEYGRNFEEFLGNDIRFIMNGWDLEHALRMDDGMYYSEYEERECIACGGGGCPMCEPHRFIDCRIYP